MRYHPRFDRSGPPSMKLSAIVHPFRMRPRLMIATLVGIACLIGLPAPLPPTTRALLAWDVGVGLYLALAWVMMLRSDLERMRRRANVEDDGAVVILTLTVITSIASLVAILVELIDVSDLPPHEVSLRLALVVITIVLSWAFIHTAFALHYAHEFYDDDVQGPQACLVFPGTDEPDYVDFAYFAFVIGMTSQTSDVQITSKAMRRLAVVHGVISFFFNTTLLAVTINLAAGLA
jgi:uncharacterized membrane protein